MRDIALILYIKWIFFKMDLLDKLKRKAERVDITWK
jgi:hypothetical protein